MIDIEKIKEVEKSNKYKKKILDIKYESLPFLDFQSTRYSMTSKLDASKVYEHSKKNGIPFFNLTSACILCAINEIPELKKELLISKLLNMKTSVLLHPSYKKINQLEKLKCLL